MADEGERVGKSSKKRVTKSRISFFFRFIFARENVSLKLCSSLLFLLCLLSCYFDKTHVREGTTMEIEAKSTRVLSEEGKKSAERNETENLFCCLKNVCVLFTEEKRKE